MRNQVLQFDPGIPIERATTPPASWYTDPRFLDLERQRVFKRTWQAVGRTDQLERSGDYVSGEIVGEPFVVLRDTEGALRAFFNVCRHHATCIVQGDGNVERLACPYHGWTYELNGRLCKAPRMAGVQEFDRDAHGLLPLEADTWGPFVFVRIEGGGEPLERQMAPLDGRADLSRLRFVKRASWEIRCNWKVYVDNYLDGGYHVEYLHRGLASQLDLAAYHTEIAGRVSLQVCAGGSAGNETEGVDFEQRIGDGAVYAFVYPNFMVNRYGPILDTNLVLPLSHDRTLTIFDYYFEEDSADDGFVARSLEASDRVQQEDIVICESVQRGLASSGFDRGRYAPQVEQAEHHFHRLLAEDLRSDTT